MPTILFQHHQLPRFDMYSFTVAGAPWINHEWLSEVPYYLAWRAWGLAGINAVMLVVIELIFLGLLYLCYQESGHFQGFLRSLLLLHISGQGFLRAAHHLVRLSYTWWFCLLFCSGSGAKDTRLCG